LNIQFDAQLLMNKHRTGISRTAQNLIECLARTNQQNTYILNYFAMFKAVEKRKLISDLLELECKPNECRLFVSSLYKALYNFIPIPYSLFFGGRSDITHFMNYYVPPGAKGKIITMVYDMVYKVFPETMNNKTFWMLNHSMKSSCERADVILTISQFSKNEIVKYMNIPDEKIEVMPCGVDHGLYMPDYDINDITLVKDKLSIEGDYFLYLGTLEPRKNIERLIESYALLKNRISVLPKLVIAGPQGWLYNTIFQKANALGLQNEVVFTGYIDEKDAPVLMKGAVSFLFPSLYEGFGMPPLEAMACGTPVITSNVASLPEVVGDAAILVDPFSVDSIADALEHVLNDRNLRDELSRKGLDRASQFSWDRSAKIVSDIYTRLLN
jgi:glycosyltransferase involved in cell wall biosynthesis